MYPSVSVLIVHRPYLPHYRRPCICTQFCVLLHSAMCEMRWIVRTFIYFRPDTMQTCTRETETPRGRQIGSEEWVMHVRCHAAATIYSLSKVSRSEFMSYILLFYYYYSSFIHFDVNVWIRFRPFKYIVVRIVYERLCNGSTTHMALCVCVVWKDE